MSTDEAPERGNVVPLWGDPLPGEPDADIVNVLENLLQQARSGEIVCLVAAGLRPSGDPMTVTAILTAGHWLAALGLADILRDSIKDLVTDHRDVFIPPSA